MATVAGGPHEVCTYPALGLQLRAAGGLTATPSIGCPLCSPALCTSLMLSATHAQISTSAWSLCSILLARRAWQTQAHGRSPQTLRAPPSLRRRPRPPRHARPPALPRPQEVTLLREYAQGPSALAYCLPSGAFDPRKHRSWLDCAQAELSEEVRAGPGLAARWRPPAAATARRLPSCLARVPTTRVPLPMQAMLTGGEWTCLLPDGHPGIAGECTAHSVLRAACHVPRCRALCLCLPVHVHAHTWAHCTLRRDKVVCQPLPPLCVRGSAAGCGARQPGQGGVHPGVASGLARGAPASRGPNKRACRQSRPTCSPVLPLLAGAASCLGHPRRPAAGAARGRARAAAADAGRRHDAAQCGHLPLGAGLAAGAGHAVAAGAFHSRSCRACKKRSQCAVACSALPRLRPISRMKMMVSPLNKTKKSQEKVTMELWAAHGSNCRSIMPQPIAAWRQSRSPRAIPLHGSGVGLVRFPAQPAGATSSGGRLLAIAARAAAVISSASPGWMGGCTTTCGGARTTKSGGGQLRR